jgi:hypothetical protein
MNSEIPNTEARCDGKESLGGGSWFATFSLLDAGCAINSSQMQRLVAYPEPGQNTKRRSRVCHGAGRREKTSHWFSNTPANNRLQPTAAAAIECRRG